MTTPNWLEVPLAMRDGLGLRLELRLPDPRESNVRVRRAAPPRRRRAARPGWGLDDGRPALPVRRPRIRVDRGHQRPARRPVRTAGTAPPSDLDPATVAPLFRGPERIVVGQREQDLAPVVLDFAANPLLMVFGDTRSGKNDAAASPDPHDPRQLDLADVAFTVLDRRLHLVDEPLFPDNEYSPDIDRIGRRPCWGSRR